MASTPTTFDTDCKFMLHMNGSDTSTTFTDSSASPNIFTARGNAQIDTSQYKFGGASGLFDGAGDYIDTPDNAAFDCDGDFTIDFQVKFTDADNSAFLCSGAGGADWFRIRLVGGTLQVRLQGGTNFTFAWAPIAGPWYHLAIVRTSGTIRCFVDGSQIGTDQSDSSTVSLSNTAIIGYDVDSTVYLTGWLDEFRFVVGTAVWTSAFTAPTVEYIPTPKGVNQIIWL